MPQTSPRSSGAHTPLQGATQEPLAEPPSSKVLLACPAPPPPRAPGPLGAHTAQPLRPPHDRGRVPASPRSPHCSSVPSGHCCSPSQSQGTGMQPAPQTAWREAAHVGLAGAAGEKDPGPGQPGQPCPAPTSTHPTQLPLGGSQHSPVEGVTSPSLGHPRTSCRAGGRAAASRSPPGKGRDPPQPP